MDQLTLEFASWLSSRSPTTSLLINMARSHETMMRLGIREWLPVAGGCLERVLVVR